jgi:uncharacterized protein
MRSGSPPRSHTAAGVDDSTTRQRLQVALRSALAERRRLDAGEADQIVRAEIAERRTAAQEYEARGHPDRAARLRREATILLSALERVITGAGGTTES